MDPPEEDVAGLTIDRGRSHPLEPPGVADGMVDRVAATYSIPTISNTTLTELPVASAVPIVTDAMGTDTTNMVTSSFLSNHSDRSEAERLKWQLDHHEDQRDPSQYPL